MPPSVFLHARAASDSARARAPFFSLRIELSAPGYTRWCAHMDVDEYLPDVTSRYPMFNDTADESMFLPGRISCGTSKPIVLPVDRPIPEVVRNTCGWKPKPNPWGNSRCASAIENMCGPPAVKQWKRSGDAHRTFGSSEYMTVNLPTLQSLTQGDVYAMFMSLLFLMVGIALFIAYGVNEIRKDVAAIKRMMRNRGGAGD